MFGTDANSSKKTVNQSRVTILKGLQFIGTGPTDEEREQADGPHGPAKQNVNG